MKCQLLKTAMTLLLVLLLALAGCGGGGSASTPGATVTADALITGVGSYYQNAAPDYFTSGTTCLLTVKVYYDTSLAPTAIDSLAITGPGGWHWRIPASSSQLGSSSDGKPYLGGNIYYGTNPRTMPLAGNWTFQLILKNGQIATAQRKMHEPGSSADATHSFVYASEDWAPADDASQYTASLSRFPASGYTLRYDPANGGTITSTGLSAARSTFLAAEPHAYNMVCWLYDANKTYLGNSAMEFSPLDHSRTTLFDGNGELAIAQSGTFSSAPTSRSVDLSAVRYVRFVYFDGAQYAPQSYSSMNYRSISAQVFVNSGNSTVLGGSMQGEALSLANDVTTVAGAAGQWGSSDGIGGAARFRRACGVTTDGANLYIADQYSATIRKMVIATGAVTTIAGSAGSEGGTDGIGSEARFYRPVGITTDGVNLYVTDYYSIRKVEISTGKVTTIAGLYEVPGSSDGVGAAATFSRPSGITTDGANLYIADTSNYKIRKVVIASGAVTTIAGSPIYGTADGIGSAAKLYDPYGITTDGKSLYVTDNDTAVRKIDLSTMAVTTFAGRAQSFGFADGIGTSATFNRLSGITTDGSYLYVVDTGNEAVRRVSIATGEVTTIAGVWNSITPVDGNGSAARFWQPDLITTDGVSLYLSDDDGETIRKIR